MTTKTLAQAIEPSTSPPDTDLGSCGRAGRQQPIVAAPSHEVIVVGETDLFGRPLDGRNRALADGFAVRRQNRGAWPVIGAGLNLPDGRTFEWSPFGAQFRSGTTAVVYASLADGLCDVGKTARLSLAKIGISTRPDLTARMAEANADRYGSIYESDGRIVDEPGFNTYEPLRLPPHQGPEYLSPVERLPRALMVSLPASMSVAMFDAAFTEMLMSCEVSCWIDTPEGERHCTRLEVDPRQLRRFTGALERGRSYPAEAFARILYFPPRRGHRSAHRSHRGPYREASARRRAGRSGAAEHSARQNREPGMMLALFSDLHLEQALPYRMPEVLPPFDVAGVAGDIHGPYRKAVNALAAMPALNGRPVIFEARQSR